MQLYSSVIPIGGMATAATLDPHFDRKLEVVTAGFAREFCSLLQNKISREDASTIIDYMISLNSEVNPSVNYRRDIIRCLAKFCHFKHSFCPKERANLKHVDKSRLLHSAYFSTLETTFRPEYLMNQLCMIPSIY